MSQFEENQIKEPLIEKQEVLLEQKGHDQVLPESKTERQLIQDVINSSQNEKGISPKKKGKKGKKPKKDAEKVQKQEKKSEQTESVSFRKLISLSDRTDVILMILGSIAALCAGGVMPLFSFFFGDLTQIFQKQDVMKQALKVAVKFWGLGGAAWILNFTSLYCWTASGQRQSLRYRKQYYQLLLKQQAYWYDINNPNELSTRVSTEVTAIQGGISQKVANILTVMVTSTLGFFLAYYRNWQLSLVISALLPAIMISGFFVMKAMQLSTDKNTKTYSEAGAVAQQAIGSIRTIKGMVGQLFEIGKYKQKLDQAIGSSIKYSVLAGAAIGCMILVFLSSYALGFWYGKKLIVEKDYNVSDIISCFFCIMIGGASLGQSSPALKSIASAKSSAGQFWKLHDRTPTLIQPDNGKQINQINSIQFKDIVFKYKKKDEKQDESNVNVINGLNLKLQKNKVTAIVGQSGSGKTTLIQLLERFYDPNQGSVLINGIDLRQLNTKNFRQKIGYVGQQPAMFALSIRQNLRFAKEDATEEQMIQALKKANAYDFVSKMQKGLDTFVGSSGIQISGGQKQRIAIARAILKNPSLFIFDQATSALDRVNQRQIQKTLSKLSENITTFVIAHRLSTIQNADKIIVLSKGKIVEEGTHSQMIQSKSFYYDLIKNQLLVDQTKNQKEQELPEIVHVRKGTSVDLTVKQQQDEEQKKKETEKKQAAIFSKLIQDSKEHWAMYLVGVICAAFNGVVFPLFSLMLGKLIGLMAELKDPRFADQRAQIERQINWYCLGFIGVAILGGSTTFAYHSSFGYIGEKIVYKIRQKVFSKLMRLKVCYYDDPDHNPGAVTTKLAQDAYLIHNMTTGVIGVIVLNISTITTGLIIAFYYHWILALIVIGLSPFLAISGSINVKRLKQLATQADQAFKDAGNQISDTVTNIKTVKSFGKLNYIQAEFQEKLKEPYELAKSKAFTNGFFQGLSQASIMIIYGLIFYLAAVINVKVKQFPATDIFSSVFAIVFAAVGMGNNSQMMPDMAKGKTAGASLYDILATEDEYERSLEQGGVVRQQIKGQIQFKNICFKYPSRDKKVFSNLNLNIKSLKKTAFVGQSGCGKSTVFQLLLRFYEPSSGQIRIDGRNIKQYDLYHLRSQIGVVFQEPVLFSGTIIDNIRYKNTTASYEQVIRVAKIVEAHQFIEKIENQYQSDVGNKGSKLSGGQKQRVALARCLLSNPNMFMFDQSTSALDTQTENKVFEALKKVTVGKTSMSIAHRLSTIVDNDEIYVFSDGEIIEQGTYEQLVNKGGFFYRLERGQSH